MRLLLSVCLASLLLFTAGCSGGAGGPSSGGTSTTGEAMGMAARSAGPSGQASLDLQGGAAGISQTAARSWDLAKDGSHADGLINWVVTATRGDLGAASLHVGGFVRIHNGGSANATLGNIVVNLQRKTGRKFATVSSDVADATNGDGATSARVVAGASSEGLSWFAENAASGSLEFTDASNNTAFSLVPGYELPPGQSVDLFYLANFDNSVLGIPVGEAVRAEVIVTFGNAGGRGGSGASASNVDIDGSGSLEADEAWVRSVPDRQTVSVPAVQEVHGDALLEDGADDVSSAGTVTLSNFVTSVGAGSGSETISASGTWGVDVNYDAGTDGGTATNVAHLSSPAVTFTVYGPIDPLTLLPAWQHEFTARPALDLSASNTQVIDAPDTENPPGGFLPGDFRTQTQGGWGSKPNGHNPGQFLKDHFGHAFPAGLEVGLHGAAGYSAKFTSAAAVADFLPQGGPTGAFTADTVNPTSTSAGVFGGQVTALHISVDMSLAGLTPAGLADLVVVGTGTGLDGLTVGQVLALAETGIGGGALPSDVTLGDLNEVVSRLNESFVDGNSVSGWANTHLARP